MLCYVQIVQYTNLLWRQILTSLSPIISSLIRIAVKMMHMRWYSWSCMCDSHWRLDDSYHLRPAESRTTFTHSPYLVSAPSPRVIAGDAWETLATSGDLMRSCRMWVPRETVDPVNGTMIESVSGSSWSQNAAERGQGFACAFSIEDRIFLTCFHTCQSIPTQTRRSCVFVDHHEILAIVVLPRLEHHRRSARNSAHTFRQFLFIFPGKTESDTMITRDCRLIAGYLKDLARRNDQVVVLLKSDCQFCSL